MHRRAHELTSGVMLLPLIVAGGGTALAFLAQETEQPKGTIEYDMLRLLITLVSSGGVVYLVIQRVLGIWERRNALSIKQQEASLATLTAEIAALRERDDHLREVAQEQCRADITYYRELFVTERARVDSCQAQLKRGSSGSQ